MHICTQKLRTSDTTGISQIPFDFLILVMFPSSSPLDKKYDAAKVGAGRREYKLVKTFCKRKADSNDVLVIEEVVPEAKTCGLGGSPESFTLQTVKPA